MYKAKSEALKDAIEETLLGKKSQRDHTDNYPGNSGGQEVDRAKEFPAWHLLIEKEGDS